MEDVITGTSTFIITKHEMNTVTFFKDAYLYYKQPGGGMSYIF